MWNSFKDEKLICIDLETKDEDLKENGPGYHRSGSFIAGIAIATPSGRREYYPIAHEAGENLDREKVLAFMREELSTDIPKVGANILYDAGFLHCAGVPLGGLWFDVLSAEALLREDRLSYSLDAVSKDYLGEGKVDDALDAFLIQHFGKKNPKANIWRAPGDIVAPYAIGDVDITLRTFELQRKKLEDEGLWDLFLLETKLLPMLLAMRLRGVRVDIPKAEELYERLGMEITEKNKEIEKIAGRPLSIWAAADLAHAFDDAGLSYPLTEKTRKPSITATLLERTEHPLAKLIVDVRKADKFRETFLLGSILEKHYNGRVHCQFNPLKSEAGGTISGRFSSCVASWTPIVTKRGEIPISQVQIGDEVFTHKRRWRKVTHTWIKGREQMFNVHLSNGQTLTCTGGHRVYIEELDEQSKEYSSSSRSMFFDEPTGNSGKIKHDAPQCFRSLENLLNEGRAESYRLVESFTFERGGEKPDEGENPRSTSQLEGDREREKWVSNYSHGRREDTLPQVCDEELNGFSSPSYRRRPQKQSPGQLSSCDSEGSSNDSFFTKARSEVVTIEKVIPCEDLDVFDITVEEDESYLACGIFSHNSSPNLQFIPTRTETGKLVRSLFIADEGEDMFSLDYSQIEYRLLAHYAYEYKLPGAEEVFDKYRENEKLDFHQAMADLTGLPRSSAKTIVFGIAYGQGVNSLKDQLGISQEAAERLLGEFHKRAPFVRALSQRVQNQTSQYGVIRTLLGRKRRFDSWVIIDKSGSPVILKKRVYGAKRAFVHKSLNALIQGSAADVMKKAMLDVWESGICDTLGVPAITCHDELVGSIPQDKKSREAVKELIYIMSNTVKLHIPLLVDGNIGANWAECK